MHFGDIRTAVVRTGHLGPFGTAVGCASDIVIPEQLGRIRHLGSSAVRVPIGPYGPTTVTAASESEVRCQTPTPSAVDLSVPFTLRVYSSGRTQIWGGVGLDGFAFFDLGSVDAVTVLPMGAPYNQEVDVRLIGNGFTNYGSPACSLVATSTPQRFCSTAMSLSARSPPFQMRCGTLLVNCHPSVQMASASPPTRTKRQISPSTMPSSTRLQSLVPLRPFHLA